MGQKGVDYWNNAASRRGTLRGDKGEGDTEEVRRKGDRITEGVWFYAEQEATGGLEEREWQGLTYALRRFETGTDSDCQAPQGRWRGEGVAKKGEHKGALW